MSKILPSATASVLLITLLAGACGPGEDPRVANLSTGISRDSALSVMGGGTPTRVDPYLVAGEYIEVLFYDRPGREPTSPGGEADRERTPVVVIDGLVTGWGWAHWDSLATAHNIAVPPPAP